LVGFTKSSDVLKKCKKEEEGRRRKTLRAAVEKNRTSKVWFLSKLILFKRIIGSKKY
jgi:hypothetical protein